MKNQTILTIGNTDTYLTLAINTNKNKTQARKELITKFVAWYDTMRFCNAKTFKANKPLDVKFTVNSSVVFDSKHELVAEGAGKLMIQNTPAGRSRFEARLDKLVSLVQMFASVEDTKTEKERNDVVSSIREVYYAN